MSDSSDPAEIAIYARAFEAGYSFVEVRLRFFEARADAEPRSVDIVMTPSGAYMLLELLRDCLQRMEERARGDLI